MPGDSINSLARLAAGEGKRRGCCVPFRNSCDTRKRVQDIAAIDYCQVLYVLVLIFIFALGLRVQEKAKFVSRYSMKRVLQH